MTEKVSVAIITRSLEVGGAEVQLTSLATGLSRDAFNVTVLCFYAAGPLLAPLKEAGIQVIALEKKGRWDLVHFFVRLVRALRQIKPDVIHGFLGPPNVLATISRLFLPKTSIVWSVRASNMDLGKYDYSWRLSFKAECWLSRFADLIVANSVAGRNYALENGFPEGQLTVVPNGIDTERFKFNPSARRAIRNEWGVSENECLIGLVGRLDPMKDHETFLKAASLLVGSGTAVRFVCIGGDGLSDQYKLSALANELGLAGRLIWAGHQGDLAAVLNTLDIHCSASISEGFSNAIAETMAAGIPNVVTDVGDSALIVGNLGKVVPPGNPAALAHACGELMDLGEPAREALGIRCTARIAEKFSRPAMIERMAALYQEQAEA
jgi:glycosyltransferase involved in cell wall biosynthesis